MVKVVTEALCRHAGKPPAALVSRHSNHNAHLVDTIGSCLCSHLASGCNAFHTSCSHRPRSPIRNSVVIKAVAVVGGAMAGVAVRAAERAVETEAAKAEERAQAEGMGARAVQVAETKAEAAEAAILVDSEEAVVPTDVERAAAGEAASVEEARVAVWVEKAPIEA